MSSAMHEPAQASAFRARRFEAWQLRRLGSRYGELPRFALPGAAPATDSAAAPRPPEAGRKRRASPSPRPDPEYEKKLEQLAQSMLGPAAPEFDAVAGADVAADLGADFGADLAADSGTDLAARRESPAAARGPAASTRGPAARGRAESIPGRAPPMAPNDGRSRFAASPRHAAAEVDSRGRREPVLEPLFADANPDPFLQRSRRRRRGRMLAGSLAAGLAFGLAAAWWFGEPNRMHSALTAVNDSALQLLASLDRPRAGERGDGAPQVQSVAKAVPQAATAPQPQDRPDPEPVVVTPAPATQAAVTQGAATTAPSDETATAMADPAPQSVSKPPVASVDASKPKAKSRQKTREPGARAEKRKPPQIAAAKSGRKPSSSAAAEKRDDDLDRLRSQAYSESSRDREQRLRPKPAVPQSSLAVTPISAGAGESRISHKKELAQCEKLDGLLYRERCKWRICDGQWGNNGCPSFPQQAVRF